MLTLPYIKTSLLLEKLLVPDTSKNQYRGELYLKIGQFLIQKNNLELGQSYLVKAHYLKEATHDTMHYISNMENIALVYTWLNQQENALSFYTQLKKKYQAKKDLHNVAISLINIGKTYKNQSKHFNAIEAYNKAFPIFKETKDTYWIARTYNMIALSYYDMFLFNKAIEYQLKALAISETINVPELTGAILNDLTILYDQIKSYNKALEYLQKAVKKFSKTEDQSFLATANLNIAHIYLRLDNMDSALAYANEGDSIYRAIKNLEGVAFANTVIAQVLNKQQKFKQALTLLENSLAYYQNINDKYNISLILSKIANVYTDIASEQNIKSPTPTQKTLLSKGIKLLNESNLLAKELNKADFLRDNYQSLALAYERMGDYKSALKNQKLYTLYKDSILNIDKIKEITSLDLQYDFDKKEAKTKSDHEKKIAIDQQKQKAKLQIGIILSSSLILLLGAGFYFYRRYENNKIKFQMTALKQEALNAQMSDHFITNSMDSINQFIQNNEKEKASEYLLRFSRLVRNVLENATEKTISLNEDLDVLKDYLELEKLRFKDHTLKYDINISPDIDVYHMQIPPMVFQTLAENAIKHGFKKSESGKITIDIAKEQNTILCSVIDNGVGRKATMRCKDSTAEKQRTSLGSGLAEKLVKTAGRYSKATSFSITDLLGDNNRPAGTQVNFSLPYILAD